MKALTVEECWTIAFEEAEECQRQMNAAAAEGRRDDHRMWSWKRDTASEIAWRIKHGERKETT